MQQAPKNRDRSRRQHTESRHDRSAPREARRDRVKVPNETSRKAAGDGRHKKKSRTENNKKKEDKSGKEMVRYKCELCFRK